MYTNKLIQFLKVLTFTFLFLLNVNVEKVFAQMTGTFNGITYTTTVTSSFVGTAVCRQINQTQYGVTTEGDIVWSVRVRLDRDLATGRILNQSFDCPATRNNTHPGCIAGWNSIDSQLSRITGYFRGANLAQGDLYYALMAPRTNRLNVKFRETQARTLEQLRQSDGRFWGTAFTFNPVHQSQPVFFNCPLVNTPTPTSTPISVLTTTPTPTRTSSPTVRPTTTSTATMTSTPRGLPTVSILPSTPLPTFTSTNTQRPTITPTSTNTIFQSAECRNIAGKWIGDCTHLTPTRTPTARATLTSTNTPAPTNTPSDGEVVLGKKIAKNFTCKQKQISIVQADLELESPTTTVLQEEICFNPETKELRSPACNTANCEGFNKPVKVRIFYELDELNLNPSSYLCAEVGGENENISFSWDDGKTYELERCYFEEDGSFFSNHDYYREKYKEFREYKKIPLQEPEFHDLPSDVNECLQNPSACTNLNVCPNGYRQIGCYFIPKPGCNDSEEFYSNCQKLESTPRTPLFSPSDRTIMFDDRTYPSGEKLPSECRAKVIVGCGGFPQMPVYYGEQPDEQCLNAVRRGVRHEMEACLNKCLNDPVVGCYAQEFGPCVSDFDGYKDGCGACEFRCRSTYGFQY
jgi:hypothetical protein